MDDGIELIEDATRRSAVCRAVLTALPEWFGIPEARDAYIRDAADLPMLASRIGAEIVGFLSLKIHTAAAAEAYVVGVRREYHRRGLGRRLFAQAERYLSERGLSLLTVKTLAATHPDPGYAATRRFYEAIGFLPVEVFPTLWGPENPCLLMAKVLGPVGEATCRRIRSDRRSSGD